MSKKNQTCQITDESEKNFARSPISSSFRMANLKSLRLLL